jgi:hypothetical protein
MIGEVFHKKGEDPVLDKYSQAMQECDGDGCAILEAFEVSIKLRLESDLEQDLVRRMAGLAMYGLKSIKGSKP